jgi:hypothetical protein
MTSAADQLIGGNMPCPKHVPLRPATSIDAELAKPHPEELTEIERKNRNALTLIAKTRKQLNSVLRRK